MQEIQIARRLFDGFPARWLWFDPRPVRVRFVVDKMELEQVLLGVLRFSPVSVIPQIVHVRIPFIYRTRQAV